jgi:TfoX/Sxy family transcriptional regulator of competence genes
MAPAKTKSKKSSTTAVKAASNPSVEIYDQLIAIAMPEIERKGSDNPYTSLNGNMFTLLHQSKSLAIRLPENVREEFIKKHNTTLFSAYGAVMKEYVAVPDGLLSDTREMKKYLHLSYEYARTLKPKPTNPKAAKPSAKTKSANAGKRKS